MVFRQLSSASSSLFIPTKMIVALIGIMGVGVLTTAKTYSSKDLLTWMQSSNFGYQVLQQALNDNQSSSAAEASCLAEVRLLLKGAEAKSLPALRGRLMATDVDILYILTFRVRVLQFSMPGESSRKDCSTATLWTWATTNPASAWISARVWAMS